MADSSPLFVRVGGGPPSAIRVVNYVAILLALLAVLVWAQLIVVAVLVGIGIGVLLAPCLQLMHRHMRIPTELAAAMLAIVGLSLMVLIAWSVSSVVDSQMTSLAERAPELIKRLQGHAQQLFSRYPWLEQHVAAIDMASSASAVGAVLFKGAWSGVGVLSALIFALVIGLYVAVEAEDYHQGLIRAFKAAHRSTAARFLAQAGQTIRIWFRAQLIDMLIIASITAIGLWLVGAEYWLLLGVLTGLLGIIPYVGIAIVVVFASLLTLGADASRLPWVLGVFLATQQLEGNLILPLVMRGKARMPAVPLLVFMLLMGVWAGLLGVLIAPPLFAVLCLAYREFYLPRVDAEGGAGDSTESAVPAPAPAAVEAIADSR